MGWWPCATRKEKIANELELGTDDEHAARGALYALARGAHILRSELLGHLATKLHALPHTKCFEDGHYIKEKKPPAVMIFLLLLLFFFFFFFFSYDRLETSPPPKKKVREKKR